VDEDEDSCKGIDWIGAAIVIVLVGIIICVGGIAITSIELELAICWCWCWVRILVGDVDGNGVGSSGIFVDRDACRVIGIINGFGGVAIIIFNIGMNVVIIVAAKWLVGAGGCCWWGRLVGLSRAATLPLTMTSVLLAGIIAVIVIVSCCVFLMVALELSSAIPVEARKAEKKAFQLVE